MMTRPSSTDAFLTGLSGRTAPQHREGDDLNYAEPAAVLLILCYSSGHVLVRQVPLMLCIVPAPSLVPAAGRAAA